MTNQSEFTKAPVRFTSGQTTSAAVNIAYTTLVGIYFPTGFEGTSVTFLGSTSLNGTYVPVIDPVTGLSVTVKASAPCITPVPAQELAVLQYFKVVSNVAVAADRECTALTRPVE